MADVFPRLMLSIRTGLVNSGEMGLDPLILSSLDFYSQFLTKRTNWYREPMVHASGRCEQGFSGHPYRVQHSLCALPPDLSFPALLPRCKELKYSKELPQISIIFIFVNEALSVILRSVHSAVNHTPTHLLKEIILVDDNSDEGMGVATPGDS